MAHIQNGTVLVASFDVLVVVRVRELVHKQPAHTPEPPVVDILPCTVDFNPASLFRVAAHATQPGLSVERVEAAGAALYIFTVHKRSVHPDGRALLKQPQRCGVLG